jgi:hypothetical protein
MIVKVTMESSTKWQSIEKIIIQSGIYKEKPLKPYDTTSIAPSGLPQLVLLDRQGRVLYMTEFEYPKLMTVPPLPPGERDDAPSVVPIENPEVTLVLPYFPDAFTIQVIAPGETRPSDSMPLSDAEFIKKNKSDSVPIEPAPSLPGSFNILIMASGYNASNMTNFQTRANSLKQTVQNTEPFKSYASKININIYNNTADLGCYTGCYNIDRLMCCDSSEVISAAVSSSYYYDEIIVIHNTATYAGGGYRDVNTYKTNSYSTYCMIYDGPYTTPMGLHEFGHSFGDLCDEYTYTSEVYEYYDCVNCRANCTDWSLYSSSCQLSCEARQTYYRPEDSVMLSLVYITYNNPSIKALYSPDGLEKRIQYFIATIIDFTPPDTQITSGPSGTITTNSAAFTYTGTDNVTPAANLLYATYLQGYDSGWSSFSSSTTKSYSSLPNGPYTFQVKAKDQAGNEDSTPATQSFTVSVDTTPPDTSITSGPSGTITTNSATFTFTGTDNITPTANLVYATYLQGYDSGWSSFSSSTTKSYTNLPNGSYTFQVKAKDEAGNEDPSPATRSFTVAYSNRCDFNGDGKTDILWRNKSTGQNVVWLMNGTTYSSYAELLQVADTNWQIVGTGDFNADGKTDILWRNKTTGQNVVWLMNGITYSSYTELLQVTDTNWEIVGPK